MRAFLEPLRQNPDIVAVLVLCLTLGVARQPLPIAWAEPTSGIKIHWTCTNPIDTAFDAIEAGLSRLEF